MTTFFISNTFFFQKNSWASRGKKSFLISNSVWIEWWWLPERQSARPIFFRSINWHNQATSRLYHFMPISMNTLSFGSDEYIRFHINERVVPSSSFSHIIQLALVAVAAFSSPVRLTTPSPTLCRRIIIVIIHLLYCQHLDVATASTDAGDLTEWEDVPFCIQRHQPLPNKNDVLPAKDWQNRGLLGR